MSAPKKNSRKLPLWLTIFVLCMFGFSYAMVPFYRVLCSVTGLNGKTSNMVYVENEPLDSTRTIKVQLVTMRNAEIPWEFFPEVTEILVHPGQLIETRYFAKNNSPKAMTIQAIPSVSPGLAASHLKKMECFCFEQQHFAGNEEKWMPLRFMISSALPKDIHTLTLSYTLFDVNLSTMTSAVKESMPHV